MSQSLIEITPDIDSLITEDDEPVDNLPSEKQQRLLTEPLYSSWAGPGAGRTFLAAANVGVFYLARRPAIVPDMFLSLDVEIAADWWQKEHRSYFLWEFGKPPELAIEIVSNKEGGEDGEKKQKYARMRVSYYVIYDPLRQIMNDVLTVYRLRDWVYERQEEAQFPLVGLGLMLWEGAFEGKHDTWLRWVDERSELILTGKERADRESSLAEQEHERAEQERAAKEEALRQLEQERQRATRMAELLRQMGQGPDRL